MLSSYFKFPDPELYISPIPNPEKPIGDPLIRNGSTELPLKQLKGEPTARLLRAGKMALKMTNIMFRDGSAKLTVSDAWTLIHPEVAKRKV